MDKTTLVKEQVVEGQELLEHLLNHGFEMSAACWVKMSEDLRWYFYIVTSLRDPMGPFDGYERLQSLIPMDKYAWWNDPFVIYLLGPSDHKSKSLLALNQHSPDAHVSFIRYEYHWLGRYSVEEGYLYLLPVPTPA